MQKRCMEELGLGKEKEKRVIDAIYSAFNTLAHYKIVPTMVSTATSVDSLARFITFVMCNGGMGVVFLGKGNVVCGKLKNIKNIMTYTRCHDKSKIYLRWLYAEDATCIAVAFRD